VIAEGPKEQAVQQAKRGAATIGEFIREQRQQGQVSLRQLARLAGVSNPYLSQIERGLRKPSAEILQQIAKGLRISAEQLYVRAGFLEFREGNQELVAAVLADDDLGERQKQVLLDIYESFRRENAQRQSEASADDAAREVADAPPLRTAPTTTGTPTPRRRSAAHTGE
jgi:transcriptional regulator with XRE-family HTH domain